jgi:hypothetical protein
MGPKPYRGMLRVGARYSSQGSPAGRSNLLLRFGLGLPVSRGTRSTPPRLCRQGPAPRWRRPKWTEPSALFSALMADTRLRIKWATAGVARFNIWEQVRKSALFAESAPEARRLLKGSGNRLRLRGDRDADPSHQVVRSARVPTPSCRHRCMAAHERGDVVNAGSESGPFRVGYCAPFREPSRPGPGCVATLARPRAGRSDRSHDPRH